MPLWVCDAIPLGAKSALRENLGRRTARRKGIDCGRPRKLWSGSRGEWIHPVVVGRGTQLFREGVKTELRLTASKTTDTGVVILTYEPAR
jgi:hypothetical protein